MNGIDINRRGLLRTAGLAGGGLLLQLTLPRVAGADAQGKPLVRSRELNAYVQIDPDGQITIYSATPEMGQGVKTALPMIVAEEMGARWEDVRVLQAPVDAERFGLQGAGGSTSIPRNFDAMRRMGASAREMLIGAAALLMEVEPDELEARDSQVVHVSGRARTFGQLASAAAEQPVPDPEFLSFKDPRAYTIIGTSIGNVDSLVIATGRSQFGIDVSVPDMRYASYTRCPRIGGRATRFNRDAILALPGVTDAFIVQPDARPGQASSGFLNGLAVLRGGVAIVGEDTWSVQNARSQLRVTWDMSDASNDSWTRMTQRAMEIARAGGGEVRQAAPGVDDALNASGNRTLEAFYQFPYVAHVCMEPMNCTAHFKAGKGGQPDTLEIWYGSQFPAQVKEIANNWLGIAPENVTVHGLRMGGGFGRRAVHDFAVEAIAVSRHVGQPVKLTWSRTDDIHNDFFRVGGFENIKAAIDANGKLAAWDQHYIGFTYLDRPAIGSGLRGNELPAVAFDNARIRQTMMPQQTPCGAWRAPGSNTNAFVEQSFIHELAVLAGRDHLEFLLELLGEPRWVKPGDVNALNTGRARDVIRMAADKAGWGRTLPAGRGLGLAFYFCHAAHVAEVAEVTVDAQRNLRVERVTVAVDVGPIINMSGALGQVQGSVIDGLSTLALQQITIEEGRIQQDNFDTYPVMRIAAAPPVDVHFIHLVIIRTQTFR